MQNLVGRRAVQLLRRRLEFGLGQRDIARRYGAEHLAALGADGTLHGAISFLADKALFQSLLGDFEYSA